MSNEEEASVFAHYLRFPQSDRNDPEPPYSVELVEYLLIGVEFDCRTVRAFVPKSLELPSRVHGFIGTGFAPTGWGITPFSNFYLALPVEGVKSTDGTPALFCPLNI